MSTVWELEMPAKLEVNTVLERSDTALGFLIKIPEFELYADIPHMGTVRYSLLWFYQQYEYLAISVDRYLCMNRLQTLIAGGCILPREVEIESD